MFARSTLQAGEEPLRALGVRGLEELEELDHEMADPDLEQDLTRELHVPLGSGLDGARPHANLVVAAAEDAESGAGGPVGAAAAADGADRPSSSASDATLADVDLVLEAAAAPAAAA